MAVLSVDLHKAINTIWDDQGIDGTFKNQWVEADRTIYSSLHDGEAGPDQPFPYCVFEIPAGSTVDRMTSDSSSGRREIRDVSCAFRVHARQLTGSGKTAKLIASELAEAIIIKYGGHPTVEPKQLILDNGEVLLVQYQTDYGVSEGDEEHEWLIDYIFRLDIPVAA